MAAARSVEVEELEGAEEVKGEVHDAKSHVTDAAGVGALPPLAKAGRKACLPPRVRQLRQEPSAASWAQFEKAWPFRRGRATGDGRGRQRSWCVVAGDR